MEFAHTSTGKLIHISKAWEGYDFYCPYCGDNLLVRKGKINKWHFAHKKNKTCAETTNDVFEYKHFDNQPSAKHINQEQTSLKLGYEEVKDLFVQQDEPIYDSFRRRWIKCEVCGKINPKDCFDNYGGKNRFNLGICKDCSSKS